jgi:hypothetical protein
MVIYIPGRDICYVHGILRAGQPCQEFRGFEAIRGGYAAAWFRLRGDLKNFNHIGIHTKYCFERRVKLGMETILCTSFNPPLVIITK